MATWFSGQAHDPAYAGAKGMSVRLGCLRDRGLLYRNIDFEPSVATGIQFRDQVWGLGQVWVATRVSLCRNRVFPRVGHSCFETENFMLRQKFQGWCCDRMFFCRDPQDRPAHTIGHWMGTTGLGCPRDRLPTVFCRDRLLKVFCHDREFFVATENPRT